MKSKIYKTSYPREEFLNLVQKALTTSHEQVIQHIFPLSPEQLTWKPDDSTWSVSEVLLHLEKVEQEYAPKMNQGFENALGSQPIGIVKIGWFSKVFAKSLGPESRRKKQKSPAMFKPSHSEEAVHVKKVWNGIHSDFSSWNQSIGEVNPNKVKISSPVSSLIRFRLPGILFALNQHNLRHLAQALELIEHRNFPKS